MNTKTFKRQYMGLLQKIRWYKEAKQDLEFAGDKIVNPMQYHQKKREYDIQIKRYGHLQETLMREYSRQIQQSL
jgi:hypothetical protein